ncbi:ATP-binding cassette, subfamily B [Cohaesibacter sp. ES.047]|uniref:ABC transporter ATP-binding protein n=1 Tax=Cohaesibacter sp. ES.047 TaxID=1798205 RepID=UPI000BB8722F|nr:ABC transporter ATP-binding protein [Cohaesibacter sp. ES.047]SNY91077.1 ATP-binding cassette, subfamily B [Cohaesibacter sp. ES.047]
MTESAQADTSAESLNHQEQETRSDLASIKRLWALAGPLRGKVMAGIIYRFAQSFCLGLAFGVVILVIGRLAQGETMTYGWAWQVTGLMVLSLFGQLLFGYLSAINSWLSSFKLASHLRLGILDHLRTLPLGFHLSRNKGDTVTVLTTDMQMLESFMSDALPRIAQAFGLPVAVLIFLFVQDWAVGLAAACSILAGVPVYLITSRWLARLGIRRQDMQAEAAARMIEYVQGIAVIRAFNRIAKGQESFRAGLKAFRDISVEMIVNLTVPIVTFGAIIMVGVPLLILVCGWRYGSGTIEVATAIAALVLAFSLYTPILGLVAVMELTRMADASLTRMDRVLTASSLPRPTSPQQPTGFEVSFDNVRFGYDSERDVLKGLTFTVPERSMTAIVGLSGAGKSTILNLLPRFWDITEGAISIGNADIRSLDPDRLNQLITVVFQDVYLFSGTIFDNIAFGRKGATLDEVRDAANAAQASDFIEALPNGYMTKVGEGGASLSGGERQRVSIARAILKDAPIILLDEATAAIDPSNERALQAALGSLVANKTLIVVAHRLSTIRAASQILVLDDGTVVEKGQHDDLVQAGGLYSRLWSHWTSAANWRIGRKARPGPDITS